MSLCSRCKAEAETVSRGPEPSLLEKWVRSLFSRSRTDLPRTIDCDDCSRCIKQ